MPYINPFTWLGTGTNYPAGPNAWNGQPLAVTPAPLYFTPNTKPPAEWFNWALYTIGQNLAPLIRSANATPAQNWQQPFTSLNGNNDFQSAAWDDTNRQWMLACDATQATQQVMIGSGADDALGWTVLANQIALANGIIAAVMKDVSSVTVYWCIVLISGGETFVYRADTAGANTWGTGPPGRHVVAAGQLAYEMLPFNGHIIYAVGAGTAAQSGVSESPDGGTTWNDHFNQLAVGAVAAWLLKANGPGGGGGNMVIAMPTLQQGGGTPQYLTSTNGSTFTVRNNGAEVGLHDVPAGLAWDAQRAKWVLAVNKGVNASPSPCTFYTSTDGLTWAAVGTIPQSATTYNVADLAVVDGVWIATSVDASNRTSQIIFSVDGGVTWYRTPVGFSDNKTAGFAYTRARLFASPTQVVALNSKIVRPSSFWGLPDAQI